MALDATRTFVTGWHCNGDCSQNLYILDKLSRVEKDIIVIDEEMGNRTMIAHNFRIACPYSTAKWVTENKRLITCWDSNYTIIRFHSLFYGCKAMYTMLVPIHLCIVQTAMGLQLWQFTINFVTNLTKGTNLPLVF